MDEEIEEPELTVTDQRLSLFRYASLVLFIGVALVMFLVVLLTV